MASDRQLITTQPISDDVGGGGGGGGGNGEFGPGAEVGAGNGAGEIEHELTADVVREVGTLGFRV